MSHIFIFNNTFPLYGNTKVISIQYLLLYERRIVITGVNLESELNHDQSNQIKIDSKMVQTECFIDIQIHMDLINYFCKLIPNLSPPPTQTNDGPEKEVKINKKPNGRMIGII